MAMQTRLEGTPDQLAKQLGKLSNRKRYRIVEVDENIDAKKEMPAPANDAADVAALLSKWQREDNTPVAQPAPNDGTMTPSEALFHKWAAEDALLTPEEIAAEARFWESYQRERERVVL